MTKETTPKADPHSIRAVREARTPSPMADDAFAPSRRFERDFSRLFDDPEALSKEEEDDDN
jgi:hypothetical protein